MIRGKATWKANTNKEGKGKQERADSAGSVAGSIDGNDGDIDASAHSAPPPTVPNDVMAALALVTKRHNSVIDKAKSLFNSIATSPAWDLGER